jgi:hypothetical protein
MFDFHDEKVVILPQPPKQEVHPLSAVRDYVIFVATLHIKRLSPFATSGFAMQ